MLKWKINILNSHDVNLLSFVIYKQNNKYLVIIAILKPVYNRSCFLYIFLAFLISLFFYFSLFFLSFYHSFILSFFLYALLSFCLSFILLLFLSICFCLNSKWHVNVHIISWAKRDWQQNWKWHQQKNSELFWLL